MLKSVPTLVLLFLTTLACAPTIQQVKTDQPPVVTSYSLKWVDLAQGSGALINSGDKLTVHYTGWLHDGTKFDSSRDRNVPFVFQLGQRQVITGWDTGFEGMRVGGRRKLIIPYQLAYGETAREKIPPRSELTFDIEVLNAEPVPQEADTLAAMRLFKENIDAIHKRDRARYLATYAKSEKLIRNGPDSLELGFDNWSARTDSTWPDTLIATDLRVIPIMRDIVYGQYHYCVVEKGVATAGVSERIFRKTPNGWRIYATTAFPKPRKRGDKPCA